MSDTNARPDNDVSFHLAAVDGSVFSLNPNGDLPDKLPEWVNLIAAGPGGISDAVAQFMDLVKRSFIVPQEFIDGKPVSPIIIDYNRYLAAALERFPGFDSSNRVLFEQVLTISLYKEIKGLCRLTGYAEPSFLVNMYGNIERQRTQLKTGLVGRILNAVRGETDSVSVDLTLASMKVMAFKYATLAAAGKMDLDDEQLMSIEDTIRRTSGDLLEAGRIDEASYRSMTQTLNFFTRQEFTINITERQPAPAA